MIYLAAPYSHPIPAVRELRYAQINDFAARLMLMGRVVFSPISMSHEIARYMPDTFVMDHDFWMAVDLPILDRAERLVVLMLDGWQQSRGVKAEVGRARELRLPVHYTRLDDMDLLDVEIEHTPSVAARAGA